MLEGIGVFCQLIYKICVLKTVHKVGRLYNKILDTVVDGTV